MCQTFRAKILFIRKFIFNCKFTICDLQMAGLKSVVDSDGYEVFKEITFKHPVVFNIFSVI